MLLHRAPSLSDPACSELRRIRRASSRFFLFAPTRKAGGSVKQSRPPGRRPRAWFRAAKPAGRLLETKTASIKPWRQPSRTRQVVEKACPQPSKTQDAVFRGCRQPPANSSGYCPGLLAASQTGVAVGSRLPAGWAQRIARLITARGRLRELRRSARAPRTRSRRVRSPRGTGTRATLGDRAGCHPAVARRLGAGRGHFGRDLDDGLVLGCDCSGSA